MKVVVETSLKQQSKKNKVG